MAEETKELQNEITVSEQMEEQLEQPVEVSETANASAQQPVKKNKMATINRIFLTVFLLVAVIGTVAGWGTGDTCSFGWDAIAAVCPLGFLEQLLGAKVFALRGVIAFVAIILLTLLFGRFFCSWMCAVPPIQRFFKSKKRKAEERKIRRELSMSCSHSCATCGGQCSGKQAEKTVYRSKVDSRHIVLGGALVASIIAGFPVFCLVCPVGLTFAFVFALISFVTTNSLTWGLLVFPVVVILEVVVFGKWCHKLCPIGALLSLAGKHSKLGKPKVDESKCLRNTHDAECYGCVMACPEEIDLFNGVGSYDCTRCGRCAEACPTGAISFSLKGVNKNEPVQLPANEM